MRAITPEFFVSGFPDPQTFKALRAEGVTTIINNRPDGEVSGQPSSDTLAQLAKGAGLNYFHIPVAGELSTDIIAKTRAVQEASDGPILAFCASGMRSALVWCFVHAKAMGVDTVIDLASAAGYDLTRFKPQIEHFD